jgi:hypothetical protein
VQYKNVQFTVWDIGGQEKLRPLWKHYFCTMAVAGHCCGHGMARWVVWIEKDLALDLWHNGSAYDCVRPGFPMFGACCLCVLTLG